MDNFGGIRVLVEKMDLSPKLRTVVTHIEKDLGPIDKPPAAAVKELNMLAQYVDGNALIFAMLAYFLSTLPDPEPVPELEPDKNPDDKTTPNKDPRDMPPEADTTLTPPNDPPPPPPEKPVRKKRLLNKSTKHAPRKPAKAKEPVDPPQS